MCIYIYTLCGSVYVWPGTRHWIVICAQRVYRGPPQIYILYTIYNNTSVCISNRKYTIQCHEQTDTRTNMPWVSVARTCNECYVEKSAVSCQRASHAWSTEFYYSIATLFTHTQSDCHISRTIRSVGERMPQYPFLPIFLSRFRCVSFSTACWRMCTLALTFCLAPNVQKPHQKPYGAVCSVIITFYNSFNLKSVR